MAETGPGEGILFARLCYYIWVSVALLLLSMASNKGRGKEGKGRKSGMTSEDSRPRDSTGPGVALTGTKLRTAVRKGRGRNFSCLSMQFSGRGCFALGCFQ